MALNLETVPLKRKERPLEKSENKTCMYKYMYIYTYRYKSDAILRILTEDSQLSLFHT